MESHSEQSALEDDDALSLWVGRVARGHAHVEYGVSNVHRFLSERAGQVRDGKTVTGVDQLIGECRKLLRTSGADVEVQSAGDAALLAAREVTRVRNRVLHDMWLPSPVVDSDSPRWNTFRRTGGVDGSYSAGTAHDLATVIEAHNAIRRTRWRVSGLFMALNTIWPSGLGPPRKPPAVESIVPVRSAHD